MTRVDDLDARATGVRRIWRRVGVLAVAGACALTLAWMAAAASIDALWRGTVTHAAALAQRLPPTQARRSCLWGATEHGNAWVPYRAALRALEAEPLDAGVALRLLAARSALDRRERDALLQGAASALELLRAGAHLDVALASLPSNSDADPTAQVHQLAALARLRAEQLAEHNDADGTVQQLLDLLQFGRDLMATPRWREEALGMDVIAATFEYLAANDGLRLVRMPAQALSALELGLADLEAGLPTLSNAILGDAVDLVLRLDHDEALARQLAMQAFGAWRYGFSARAMAAHYLEHIDQHARDCAGAHAHPGEDLVAELVQLRRRIETSSNPLTRRVAIAGEGDPRRRVHTLVRLRLLRIATQYRQGRIPEALADPGGGLLTVALIESQLRIRSRHAGAPSLTVAGAR